MALTTKSFVLPMLALTLCVSCATTNGPNAKDGMLEKQVLEVARLYEKFYNTDIKSFAALYTEDCIVNGGVYRGRETLFRNESAYLNAAPNRIMRIDETHASGDIVIVQGVILDPDRGADWVVPFSAVLTCRDGKIAQDWTYAEFSKFASSE